MIEEGDYNHLARLIMAKNAWSQRELALRLGITPSHVSHLLQGRRKWSVMLRSALVQCDDVPLETALAIIQRNPKAEIDHERFFAWLLRPNT